jgi:hypothetical protein
MSTTAVNRVVVTFRDVRGFTALHTYYINVTPVSDRFNWAANIFNTLQDLSNAAIQSSSGLVTTPPRPYLWGEADPYSSVGDKADMIFSTDSGGLYHYKIPAPIIGLFLQDGETIDPGNADVMTWTAAMLANHACAKNGDLLTRWITGRLVRTTKPKRLSSLTFNPSLDGPGW